MRPIPSRKRRFVSALWTMPVMALLCGFCMSVLMTPNTASSMSRTSAWAIGSFIPILTIAICLAIASRLWSGGRWDHSRHALTGLLSGVFTLLLYSAFSAGMEWAFSTSDLLLKLTFVLSGLFSAGDYYFAARVEAPR